MPEPEIATKESIVDIFDGAASRYDREGPSIFRTLGAHLVDWVDIPLGARVLDVSTGTGAVLIPAAQRVGADGSVIGIDLSAGMLAEAEKNAQQNRITNYQLLKMDAERLEFPDESFDAVTCGFSIFFFPSIQVALSEMHRVLKPSGKLGVSVFGRTPGPFEPGWRLFAEQAQAYGVAVRTPQRVAYNPEELQALLESSGFTETKTHTETLDAVYPTEEDWWAFQLTLATRAAILRMTPETRAQFKSEYLAKLRPLFRADGLHLPVPAVYAASKPRTQLRSLVLCCKIALALDER
jgi:ubiquinone/menaquinone biosynthesis C-methylase UbiE